MKANFYECTNWGKIVDHVKYLYNIFPYLLQTNLCLWSKISQIPRYFLLTVFPDRNVL